MARGIDDVDLSTVVHNGSIFCEDSDTSFTLYVVRVHNTLSNVLVLTEHTALLEHLVNEGSLTVVNVGDDSDVSQIFSNHIFFPPD